MSPFRKRDEFIPFIDWNGEWRRINHAYKEIYADGDFSKKEETKMGQLTKEEAIRKHRVLWAYMAAKLKEGDITKEAAIIDIFPGQGYSYNKCYLCDYARSKCDEYKYEYPYDTEDICKYCPLCDNGKCGSNCLSGKFDDFRQARYEKNFTRASELAFEIATLPEVEKESECDVLLNKLHIILSKAQHRCSSRNNSYYIWMLGSNIINILKKAAQFEINPLEEKMELFGIKVEKNIRDANGIELYRKCD